MTMDYPDAGKAVIICEGLGFPEGPVVMRDGSILLVEIEYGLVSRIARDGRRTVVAEVGGGPNGAAIGPDGALYICNNGGMAFETVDGVKMPRGAVPGHGGGSIQRLDLSTGTLSTLYETAGGHRLIAPNDLVFDGHGGFWFTDHGTFNHEAMLFGALCYARADGRGADRVRGSLMSPNGVGLSPDGSRLYVADTWTGRLLYYDVIAPGVVAEPPPFHPGHVVATLPGFQLLDSLALEESGRVCVGTLVNGGITVFAPDGTVEHVAFPDQLVTNLCFGGADMRDLWITCSGTGRLMRTRWPRAGLRPAFSA